MDTSEGEEKKKLLECALPHCKGLRCSIANRFPKNPLHLQLWLDAFDNPTLNEMPRLQIQFLYVCSRHFRDDDYVNPSSRKLNSLAVPSLNLKALNELDKCRHKNNEKMQDSAAPNLSDSDTDENNYLSPLIDSRKKFGENISFLKSTIVTGSDVNDGTENVPSVENPSSIDSYVTVHDSYIEIWYWQHKLAIDADFLWLRHMCDCSQCFDYMENRRLCNFCEFDNDLQPVECQFIDDATILGIMWSDGHASAYNLDNVYKQHKQEFQPTKKCTPILWNYEQTQYLPEFEPISCHDLINSNDIVCYKALNLLQKFGVLIINQIPKYDKDSLLKKSIITKLFNHPWHKFSTEKRKLTSEYAATTPFSNCTFESMDKGLQILTVEDISLQLILADGFNCLQQIPEADRSFLTKFEVCYSFINDNGYKFTSKTPVVLNRNSLERIWFSTFHLDNIKSKDYRQIFNHFQALNEVLKMGKNQWPVELNAETIIVLDNYRICWCLKAPTEDCELDCVYMQRKHYLSILNPASVISSSNE